MSRMRRLIGAVMLAAAASLCVPAALAGPQESPGVKSTGPQESPGVKSTTDDPPGVLTESVDNSTDLGAELVTYLSYYVP